MARFVEALDRDHRVAVVPFQHSAARGAAGLTFGEAERAAWAIAAGGRRYRGAGALNAALATLLRSRLPLLLYQLPGSHRLQDRLYDWVAANRSRFPGDRPYCEQFPEHCR